MNKTKKSQAIFSIVMLLAFIPLLFTAIIRMDKVESRTETIGETILEVKQINEKAEKALFYLEQSAQYVIYDMVGEIQIDPSICNQTYLTSMEDLFEQNLKIYTSHYPDKEINFPIENNYEITLINDGNVLIANAKSNLFISFNKGTHSINPSFSLTADYNFSKCTLQETTEEETSLV